MGNKVKKVDAPKADQDETWKKIPGLDYYEASTHGRIRSLDRHRATLNRWGQIIQRFHHGRILKATPKPNGSGQFYMSVYTDGGKYKKVSRLVCLTFNGPPPSKTHEAAHCDGDTENNRPWNLVWLTPKENASHKKTHGTNPTGEKNGMARLRPEHVREIFEGYCCGVSRRQISSRFGISDGAVIQIISGRTWGHLDVPKELRDGAKLRARLNIEKSWAAAALRMETRGPSLRPPP